MSGGLSSGPLALGDRRRLRPLGKLSTEYGVLAERVVAYRSDGMSGLRPLGPSVRQVVEAALQHLGHGSKTDRLKETGEAQRFARQLEGQSHHLA
jgi:hypothetical protein